MQWITCSTRQLLLGPPLYILCAGKNAAASYVNYYNILLLTTYWASLLVHIFPFHIMSLAHSHNCQQVLSNFVPPPKSSSFHVTHLSLSLLHVNFWKSWFLSINICITNHNIPFSWPFWREILSAKSYKKICHFRKFFFSRLSGKIAIPSTCTLTCVMLI